MKGETTVKELQIKNFRSLKDTGSQKLSPITILVGENSSGKSTFLRAFPLLKQSISKRTSGPILWAGDIDDYVDFGSFEETVTNDGSDEIIFKLKFDIEDIGWYHRLSVFDDVLSKDSTEAPVGKIEYQITIKSVNGRDQVTEFRIKLNSLEYKFDIINQHIYVGDFFTYKVKKGASVETEVRNVRASDSPTVHSNSFGFQLPEINELWEELKDIVGSVVDKESLHRLFLLSSVVDIGAHLSIKKDPLSVLSKLKNENISDRYLQVYQHISKLLAEASSSRLKGIVEICYLYGVYSEIDEYIFNYFKNVHYIAPLRATAERYYRLRNLAVDEVDYQGKNLAIFINSLNGNKLRAFQNWTEQYFGFSVKTDISKGHLSLQIMLKGSDKAINLSDTGFGYSQILPIITQLWELSSRNYRPSRSFSNDEKCPLVIAVEQPELHLHPAVQAKLAKAFVACIALARSNKNELQLILETHSETIINSIGAAIAKGSLKAEDVSVVLFDKKHDKGVTRVRNSSFDCDGYLTDWPYGFLAPEE